MKQIAFAPKFGAEERIRGAYNATKFWQRRNFLKFFSLAPIRDLSAENGNANPSRYKVGKLPLKTGEETKMISIQTNVAALYGLQNLNTNQMKEQSTIEQMTSGYQDQQLGRQSCRTGDCQHPAQPGSPVKSGRSNGNDAVGQLQIIDGGASNISQILDRLQTSRYRVPPAPSPVTSRRWRTNSTTTCRKSRVRPPTSV